APSELGGSFRLPDFDITDWPEKPSLIEVTLIHVTALEAVTEVSNKVASLRMEPLKLLGAISDLSLLRIPHLRNGQGCDELLVRRAEIASEWFRFPSPNEVRDWSVKQAHQEPKVPGIGEHSIYIDV